MTTVPILRLAVEIEPLDPREQPFDPVPGFEPASGIAAAGGGGI
ncbi:MAG: hypothetical protein AAB223_12000 [Pseudomonadota bacterium]